MVTSKHANAKFHVISFTPIKMYSLPCADFHEIPKYSTKLHSDLFCWFFTWTVWREIHLLHFTKKVKGKAIPLGWYHLCFVIQYCVKTALHASLIPVKQSHYRPGEALGVQGS
jgi:hypothetical protein